MPQWTLQFFPVFPAKRLKLHIQLFVFEAFLCVCCMLRVVVLLGYTFLFLLSYSQWFSWWAPSPVFFWDVSASARFKEVAASFHFWLVDLTELMSREVQIFFFIHLLNFPIFCLGCLECCSRNFHEADWTWTLTQISIYTVIAWYTL